eukprot:COSAG02_NODE_4348_length_5467_cov_6.159806_1_plen_158_part_00
MRRAEQRFDRALACAKRFYDLAPVATEPRLAANGCNELSAEALEILLEYSGDCAGATLAMSRCAPRSVILTIDYLEYSGLAVVVATVGFWQNARFSIRLYGNSAGHYLGCSDPCLARRFTQRCYERGREAKEMPGVTTIRIKHKARFLSFSTKSHTD